MKTTDRPASTDDDEHGKPSRWVDVQVQVDAENICLSRFHSTASET
jgi:hypothetical protein